MDREPVVGREQAEVRFERLYGQHGRAVLAFAVRRVTDPQDAADVVAETFLVVWRRLDAVPAGEEARLWLYGIARRVLANQQRSERRRQRVAERLRGELRGALVGIAGVEDRDDVVSLALCRLALEDQEILRLSAWEELPPAQIAIVLGITRVAARARLHRARRRLRAAVGPSSEPQLDATPLQETP